MRVTRLLSLGAAVVAVLAVAAAPTIARSKDRNHDGLPDRWERHYKLSLSVNQARRDQDHDGLKNKGEFRAGTSPKDADSDDDGIEDKDENAGKIESFENGVLTIALAGGGSISGKVTDKTRIKCGDNRAGGVHASHKDDDDGPSDSSGPGHDGSDDDDSGPGESGEHHGDGVGHDDPPGPICTEADLVPGASVDEAELELESGAAVFEEIELAD